MPPISLIYTTFNRGAWLWTTLQRVRARTVPDEIIVVDDGSSDGTRSVAEQFSDLPIRYVRNERPGWGNRSLPTNIGVKLARNEHLLCTDPEVLFLTDVVGQFQVAIEDYPGCILAPWNGYHEISPTSDECLLACPGNGLHDNGGNAFLYHKSWIEEIGGYDEELEPGAWDDIDFHTRLAWCGHVQAAVQGVDIRHLWHDPIPWNAEDGPSKYRESSLRNKARVEAKRFPQDLVANKDREWGRLLT